MVVPRNALIRRCCFDPFEEQLDHPPRLVQLGDGHCGQREVVGQEYEKRGRIFRVAELYPAQRFWICFGRIEGCEYHGLVADQTCGSVHGSRVSPLELEVVFGSGDEEGFAGVDFVEPLEIEISAIHEVVRAG